MKHLCVIQRCLNICRELKSIRAEINVPLVWIQFSSSLTSLHLLDRTSELKKLLRYWLWWTRSWPAIQKKKSDISFKILPESQNHFHGCLIFTSSFLYAVVLDIVIVDKYHLFFSKLNTSMLPDSTDLILVAKFHYPDLQMKKPRSKEIVCFPAAENWRCPHLLPVSQSWKCFRFLDH